MDVWINSINRFSINLNILKIELFIFNNNTYTCIGNNEKCA